MIDYGQRIRLATIDEHHLQQLREWRNDPRIFQTCRQYDLITEGDQIRWYERGKTDPSQKMYLVMSLEKIELGVCGLTSIDLINRRAEFSLYIAPKHQNKGYGKAALKTLISHGFNAFGLHKIWGETYESNHAQYMFKELGFTTDGTDRDNYFRDGKFINSLRISLLHHEWKHLGIYDDCRQLCFT